MKYLKWMAGLLLVAAVPLLVYAAIAHGQQFGGSTRPGGVVDGTLYSAEKNLTIEGTINGDVFCAGQSVIVNAVVNGDVICAAQEITLKGRVNGNVRLAGRTVTVDAVVQRSVTVAAQTFSLDADSRVGRDLTGTAAKQTLKGMVARDVVVGGTSVVLNGVVGRTMTADSNQVELRPGARIGGNLNHGSANKPVIRHGATVNGDIKQTARAPKRSIFAGFIVYAYLFLLLGIILLGLILLLIFPKFLPETSGIVRRQFGKALLVGIITSLLLPVLFVLLMISLIGLPLALALLVAWLLAIALSGPIAAYFVGCLLLAKRTHSKPFMMIVGGIITATVYLIPFAGVLVMILVYWLGLGGLILGLQRFVHPPPEEELSEPPADKTAAEESS